MTMKATIVPIGNSKGIRIPKALLAQCNIHKDVELEVKGNAILIKSVRSKPRRNWEEAFKKLHERKEDALLISDAVDLADDDWEW